MIAINELKKYIEDADADAFSVVLFAPLSSAETVNRKLNKVFDDKGDNLSFPMGPLGGSRVITHLSACGRASKEWALGVIDLFGEHDDCVAAITSLGIGLDQATTVLGIVQNGLVLTPVQSHLTWRELAQNYLGLTPVDASSAKVKATSPVFESRFVSNIPAGTGAHISQTKDTFHRNRRELPPTFDAVIGFADLEIDRLQSRNFQNDAEKEEALRQIRTLSLLRAAVARLRELIPGDVPMSQEGAIEAEKLSRLFVAKFVDWPRVNADELVDSAWRAGLIGATAVMLPMIGVAAPFALAAGLVLFAGQKPGDAVKAAKEMVAQAR